MNRKKNDAFPWGFKSNAEKLALEVRRELQLGSLAPFDPRSLANHLAIPVLSVSKMGELGVSRQSIDQLIRTRPDEFSAGTLILGTRRLIIENPVHSQGRRTNSLAHELSHVLLEHEPGPVLGLGGCRQWSKVQEGQADWLAGVLLVPRPVALRVSREGVAIATAAETYGVSVALMRWRVNHSGAGRQAFRELQKRTLRPRK